MKIGIVCYPTLGGSGVVATELGHELAVRGHEVHFITYDIPFRLQLEEPNIYFHEVSIHQYDLFKYPDYALTLAVKIANVAKCYELDVLHVHYAIPHATSAYLAKQLLPSGGPAVITTLHGTDITLVGQDPAYFEIVKFSIEHSCGVTAVSQSLCDDTHNFFGIDKSIEVIYNFFNPRPEFQGAQPMRHLFVKGEEKLLLHSSNFRAVKRPLDVVDIFRQVREKVPCKLVFLGSGNGVEEVRHHVSKHQLNDHVFFVGETRIVDPYIASSDLFLLPSSHESFGLAALEAMAYGVPVIATEVGGLPELIDHGRSGFLAPVGDTGAMTKDAVQLLSDPQAYQKMSQEAEAQAKDKFCSTRIIPQYESYYQKVLGNG